MFQIGFIRQETYNVKDANGEEKSHKWLEGYIRIPGMVPFQIKLSKNNKKEADNHPDFHIYYRTGGGKNGPKFRDVKIGALWLKEKNDNGEVKKYMTGMMLVGLQEISLYVKKATKITENEELNHLYDLFMMTDRDNAQQTQTSYNESSYGDTYIPPAIEETQIDIPESEIPF